MLQSLKLGWIMSSRYSVPWTKPYWRSLSISGAWNCSRKTWNSKVLRIKPSPTSQKKILWWNIFVNDNDIFSCTPPVANEVEAHNHFRGSQYQVPNGFHSCFTKWFSWFFTDMHAKQNEPKSRWKPWLSWPISTFSP